MPAYVDAALALKSTHTQIRPKLRLSSTGAEWLLMMLLALFAIGITFGSRFTTCCSRSSSLWFTASDLPKACAEVLRVPCKLVGSPRA